MNWIAIMAAVVYLQVTGSVATLQCDLDTTGSVVKVVSLTTKDLQTNRLPNGKLRVLVYGLNQATFTGTFAVVDAPVTAISGVVAANPDGTQSRQTVKKVSKPKNLQMHP